MDENRNHLNRSSGESPATYGTSSGLFGETDRDSGEYHFRSGYTHQVYTNAHYIREDENTVPPKYYRPSSNESNEAGKEKNKKKKRSGFAFVLLLCFLSALIGGGAASFLTAKYFIGSEVSLLKGKASEDEIVLAEASENDTPVSENADPQEAEVTPEPVLPPSEIYNRACRQVVSIATDIVNVDRYGNQVPAVISGSGFVVSSDGFIITNYHVVEHAVNVGISVTVTMFDGMVYNGAVVGYDYEKDLAVVKIEADGLSPAVLGDSGTISVGDPVYAVGNPYGVLEFTMTVGHISALNRLIATDESEDNALNMFQIDAAVYSGNSGGPAYDAYGKVIGIISAKYLETGMEGIGFAIPINDVLPVISEMIDKDYISGRASMSAYFDENYNSVLSRYYHLPEGAFINSVSRGGCADKAGLRPGDIIMRIGEYSIDSFLDVPVALRHYKAGDKVEIVLFRDGTLYSASIVLDEDTQAEDSDYYMAEFT